MITASEIIKKYISFFEKKGHQRIPNSFLVPENDPTALFISAGMQPLIPYLLGQPHPLGKRLVGIQRCLRTDDLEEVGDKVHHTFFEMLGNWSLGDYFKKEAIEYSFEFLTSKEWLGIDKNKLAISVFAGDKDAPFDQESYDLWLKLDIPKNKITKLPKKNNWWGPAGQIGPCGPDTEMFVWAGKENLPNDFDPDNPNWIEVWNDVFMEYNKTLDGKYKLLKQKNVDTGMGLERILAVLNNTDDDYKTHLFNDLRIFLESKVSLGKLNQAKEVRIKIFLDHSRAIVFLVSEGLIPGKNEKEYVLRKLIRRANDQLTLLYFDNSYPNYSSFWKEAVLHFKKRYGNWYKNLWSEDKILKVINEEIKIYEPIFKNQEKLKLELNNLIQTSASIPSASEVAGSILFNYQSSLGVPYDLSIELAKEASLIPNIVEKSYKKELEKHKGLSRTASAGMFKGGLADNSEGVTRLHTATHLLHAALRQILGDHVQQKGSNISSERLRFDFSHSQKLTEEEIKKVEALVNEKIRENLPVKSQVKTLDEALKAGILGFFAEKYADKVTVYSIDPFSREICGGPHVDFTGKLKSFKIIKKKSLGQNLQRIYAILEN